MRKLVERRVGETRPHCLPGPGLGTAAFESFAFYIEHTDVMLLTAVNSLKKLLHFI